MKARFDMFDRLNSQHSEHLSEKRVTIAVTRYYTIMPLCTHFETLSSIRMDFGGWPWYQVVYSLSDFPFV